MQVWIRPKASIVAVWMVVVVLSGCRLKMQTVVEKIPAVQNASKRSFRPWTGDSGFIVQIESRPHRGLVTWFAMRYRRLHGGSRRGFWRRSDAGRG